MLTEQFRSKLTPQYVPPQSPRRGVVGIGINLVLVVILRLVLLRNIDTDSQIIAKSFFQKENIRREKIQFGRKRRRVRIAHFEDITIDFRQFLNKSNGSFWLFI